MPSYKVTDSLTGKSYKLTGDSAPTEQELSQIFQDQRPKEKSSFLGNLVKPVIDVAKDLGGSVVAGGSAVGEIATRAFDPQNKSKFFDKGIQAGTKLMTPEYRKAVTGGEKGVVNAPVFDKGGIADVGTRRGATVASYITPMGKGANLIKTIGKGVVSGGVSGGLSTYGAGGNIRQIGEGVVTGGVFGGAFPIAGAGFRTAQKATGNLAERVATGGLGSPSKLKKVIGLTDGNLVKLFDENNLWDRLPQSARSAAREADEAYKALISNSDAQFSKQAVVAKFYDAIERLKPYAGESQAIQNQIDELTNRALAFQNKTPNFKVGAQDIYESKKAAGSDLTETAFAPTADLKGRSLGTKQAGAIFRETLDTVSQGTKDLGRKEAALMELADIFESYQGRGAGRQVMNFTKLGSAGVGGLVAGLPGAAVGFALEALVNSPLGTKVLSKSLYALSEAELRTLSQIIQRAYQASRGALGSQMVKEKPDRPKTFIKSVSKTEKKKDTKLPTYNALEL